MKPAVVIGAGAVLVAGLVVGAFLGRSSSSAPSTTVAAPRASSSITAGYPVPPRGAVVYARQWGGEALAIGVVPRLHGVLLQASVLGPQGRGVSGLRVSIDGEPTTPCGLGCYRTSVGVVPKSVELRVRATTWRVKLPAQWPPRDGTAIVQRAAAAWRKLDSLSFHEHLASDAVHETTSDWRIQAPDRVAYQVVKGWGGIVVGDKRWDRAPNAKKWVQSSQSPVTQPVPSWVGVTDAHVLGTGTFQGRRVWNVSFFDPGTPAWFTVAIDRQTYRTLQSTMVTTAHFMRDVYGGFNATPPILPPP